MPTYKRFEDLPVWKKAADLAAYVFEWTRQKGFRGEGDSANQMQRAMLSVSNNIAEGFERGSTAELIHFLYIARGSAGEVRSMLRVMERMDSFKNLTPDIENLVSEMESVSRQIRSWADSLQNSEIKGQRHLNDQSKVKYDRKERRSEFLGDQADFRREFEARLKKEADERSEESNKKAK